MHFQPLIQLTQKGLYCPQADIYIDPWYPAGKAIITHGHSDHARHGQSAYLAHPVTCNIIRHRLGKDSLTQSLSYNHSLRINGVEITLIPAGHIPGSAQVKLDNGKESWVISGDYKIHSDGLSDPWEPVKCTHFISECTFGLPVFNWQPQSWVMNEINTWWRENANRKLRSVMFGYSLGKIQRILSNLDLETGPVYAHGAVIEMNRVLTESGIQLPVCLPVTGNEKVPENAMILAPPAASGTPWMNRMGNHRTAFASGWMSMRGSRRWQAADKGFVLSDHADWKELNQAVELSGAEFVYLTHGYKAAFARYLSEKGYKAYEMDTLFEGETKSAVPESEKEERDE